MIAIIDYGSGNVSAIANIYKLLNVSSEVISDPAALDKADRYILPGVGHFDHTMATIRGSQLHQSLLSNVVGKGKLILGICVGMQILGDRSEEGEGTGLGWIPGDIRRIEPRAGASRLPHMGWNSVAIERDEAGLFRGVDQSHGFYFLHSYHFCPSSESMVIARASYGESIVCAVTNGKNVFGVQFHPEKSHGNGITVFRNFASI